MQQLEERILDAAYRLICCWGFKKFTVDDVAGELRISKKTIYKYFKGKREMINAVVRRETEAESLHIDEIMNSDLSWWGKLAEIMGTKHLKCTPKWVFDELEKSVPDAMKLMLDTQKKKQESAHLLMLEGRREGALRDEINLVIFEKAMKASIEALIEPDFLTQNGLTFKEIIEQVGRLFFFGILKDNELRSSEHEIER